jgi:opacity protein-like surface antigen
MFLLLLVGLLPYANAQQKVEKKGFMEDKTLFEELTNMKKKTDKFNLFLNMQGSFDLNFRDGLDNGSFKMRQLRIEAKGQITPWLSYRYRQRLNRSNDGSGMMDNVPTSIDYAMIGVKPIEDLTFNIGKQCAAYGGIEFDLNPIEIYEYSDMIDNMSNFMTGLNTIYDLTPTQQLQLQILNSRNGSMESTYGVSPDIRPSKLPLVYTLNWNGSFSDVFKTRWSASAMSEAKDKWLYYLAFGNELTLDKFNMFVDVMYSSEDIDREGVITSIVPKDMLGNEETGYHHAFDTRYLSLVAKLNYRFLPKWNVFVKGMYETASVAKANEGIEKGKYRTSWGYLAGIEYYPMKTNLHFFLTYVGRSYDFTNKAEAFGSSNYNTNRLSLGFIYQLPVF